ncbi:hypothetical protein FB45DRAFT_1007325 [Roridomyces roridus]|uniref:Uncharacterized protein n=1 Tax=Roridomyces roridus TaxID=1738132 RepID=A0AAD7BET2_9AGAR|nr:hypothetical protein FB45DRAFT_1007325 [Roridomyces roridus]
MQVKGTMNCFKFCMEDWDTGSSNMTSKKYITYDTNSNSRQFNGFSSFSRDSKVGISRCTRTSWTLATESAFTKQTKKQLDWISGPWEVMSYLQGHLRFVQTHYPHPWAGLQLAVGSVLCGSGGQSKSGLWQRLAVQANAQPISSTDKIIFKVSGVHRGLIGVEELVPSMRGSSCQNLLPIRNPYLKVAGIVKNKLVRPTSGKARDRWSFGAAQG